MLMKARDIIPGWPKGRSTVSAATWNYANWWYSQYDFACSEENRRYHEAQQRMVTSHIESGLNRMVFLYNPTVPFRSDGGLERAIALAKARIRVDV